MTACPQHPDARTLASAKVSAKWGRYHRCEAGHGFYVRSGAVTHVTTHRGGQEPLPVPCGICGEPTFARNVGRGVNYRRCFAGHSGRYSKGAHEYLGPTVPRSSLRIDFCPHCGKAREDRQRKAACGACRKRIQRSRRTWRSDHPCPCGEDTASLNSTSSHAVRGRRASVRECRAGHRSYWRDGEMLRLVRGAMEDER